MKLPEWEDSGRLAWPPPHDPRFSADWAAAREQDRARRAAKEKRWEEEEAARQEANKKAYEARLRR